MSYDVRVDEADALFNWVGACYSDLSGQLSQASSAVEAFASLEGLQGAAAQSAKAYFSEVHLSAAAAIDAALLELLVRCSEYVQPYFGDIDGSLSARFGQDALSQAASCLSSARDDLFGKQRSLAGALAPVSDLVDGWTPSLAGVDDALWGAADKARALEARVSEHESYHAAQAQSVDRLAQAAASFVSSCGATAASGVTGYAAGTALGSEAFAALAAAYTTSAAYTSDESRLAYVQAAVDALSQRAYDRWEAEEAKRLEEEGFWQAVAAGTALVVGAVVCFATAGAATPVVAAAIWGTFGVSAAFQVSEMYEGSEKMRLGAEGDVGTKAFNPLRDTVFGGDQQAYEAASFCATAAAGLAAPVGLVGTAWKTGGTAALKSAAVLAVKDVGKDIFADVGMQAAGTAIASQAFKDNPAAGRYFADAVGALGGLSGLKGASLKDVDMPNLEKLDLPDGALDIPPAGAAGTGLKNADIDLPEKVVGTNKTTPIENGPYIKDGKPNGRPTLSGEKKLQFEAEVYNRNVDPDGILRDPNTGEVIDWKPGQPRKGVVDFGHKPGASYSSVFKRYRNGEIELEDLKKFQFDPDNYQLETPSTNRGHKYE